jgi:hypothetical protein
VLKACGPVTVAGVALAVQVVMAMDVKVDYEKTFDFKAVRSWAWNPEGPGEVMMNRSAQDDPKAMRERAEPIIMNEVRDEMQLRHWRLTDDPPDLTVTYFLLLSTNVSTQSVGQFLPNYATWGVPLYAPTTQSIKFMNQGSLLLDLKANKKIVWRGLAEAQIKVGENEDKRKAKLRDAVRTLIRRVPK